MSKPFKILSLDGGGLRGIIPVLILSELEKRTGKRIVDEFDLIAGTSTGALIACGLTVSNDGINPLYTINDLLNIYMEKGSIIFPRKGWLGKIVSSINSLTNPRFKPDGLHLVLTELLGNKCLSDCIKPVFISSYDLLNNEALLFKQRQALAEPSRNALLYDVCRATSAAPTYLPAYSFHYNNHNRLCVDGGIYMNNPTVGVLVEVLKYKDRAPYSRPDLQLEDIHILSLGTGQYTRNLASKKVEGYGLLNWATQITDVMMQAVNKTTSYQADELVSRGNFLRVSLDIEDSDYSDMADSREETRNYLISQVQKQIFNEEYTMKQLTDFIKRNDSPLLV